MHASRALLVFATAGLVACSGSSGRGGFDTPAPEPGDTAAPAPTGDFDTKPPPTPTDPPEINEVFGHSASRLYRLDPKTKAVTEVGMFDGCGPIIDIALDESSTLFATNYDALYKVDKATAECTEIARGKYPNSLSFVPKGTVDASVEALVGYEEADYVRIDTTTGAKTKIGALGGGMRSSGDIVSVKGGKTYLTVKGGSCTGGFDCLVEVDPATGKMLKNWGSIEHKNVFGLAFWGGKVYGFNDEGTLFEVTFGTTQLATSVIPVGSKPADLSFWGAGSSTSAPLVATPQ
ncbi:MAG: hypothetical protein KF819_15250 [Labilithrix sp.]|nr:hypothetical protein [Labilithrix sp.]